MRINLYEEELTAEVKLVTKDVPQSEGVTERFYGLRLFLESPAAILEHSTPEDDDRNAVTFWVRESGLQRLEGIMQRLHSRVAYERLIVDAP